MTTKTRIDLLADAIKEGDEQRTDYLFNSEVDILVRAINESLTNFLKNGGTNPDPSANTKLDAITYGVIMELVNTALSEKLVGIWTAAALLTAEPQKFLQHNLDLFVEYANKCFATVEKSAVHASIN